jgi:hypothetical protein
MTERDRAHTHQHERTYHETRYGFFTVCTLTLILTFVATAQFSNGQAASGVPGQTT